MKLYEGLFVFAPDLGSDAKEAALKKLEAVVEKFEGKVKAKLDWGKKKIGYLIKKHKEGQFFVLDIEMDTLKVDGFRRALELHEGLLKYMVTVKDLKAAPVGGNAPASTSAPSVERKSSGGGSTTPAKAASSVS